MTRKPQDTSAEEPDGGNLHVRIRRGPGLGDRPGLLNTGYPFSCLPDEFKGKRVLVTGGTKGVGAATVQRFQMSGALVATTARSESSEGLPSRLFIRADIGIASGVQEVVDRIEREWGGVDILVNNAGG